METYTPSFLETPTRMPNWLVTLRSAWRPNHKIIAALIKDFNLKTDRAIEFGVDYGFSLVALSTYFKEIKGVDHFEGDIHTGKRSLYDSTKSRTDRYPNIELVQADYKDFIAKDQSHYNLAHVDIIHTYDDTFACGLWAAKHADMVLFHDTLLFPEVKRAVEDIAAQTGKKFYNYNKRFGLGIVV